ncbi:hypothetical protein H0E84_04580 [Luteimonas sp. SJ-92]|uniref:Uncharacterized protein n=1 Tax=Luteimonas salinisoli TaxID=2752307 RepID=A0A853JAF4_9GAMM|nr:hypothetical protein [Luteimonas salinisoli]NZA25649.1 hypothetical protein [Luteimonas salinisoli]
MHVRNRIRALALALLLPLAAGAVAQDYAHAWDPRSGDEWVDAQLTDINDYGRRHHAPFVDELVRYRGAPRDLVTDLLVERGWAPGDVYFACSIAQVIGRSCRYVIGEWDRSHGEGWGALASRLGVAPGSEEFLRLKQGVVSSYGRWARPLEPDAALREAAPPADAGGAEDSAGPA